MGSDSPSDQAWSAFLFPDSSATEGEIRRFLSFFDQVTIPQPWHMDDRLSFQDEKVRVVRPPEGLCPVGGFRSLLTEYKDWMRRSPDHGQVSALSAIERYGKRDESTWDIRRAIRNTENREDSTEVSATRWHLILHLARETEQMRREAGDVLRVLQSRGGPLRGIVEEEQVGILEDLPQFDDGPEMGEQFLDRVFDAWFGLFHALLARRSLLVTTRPAVMECLSGLWDEFCAPGEPYNLSFRWPDLFGQDPGVRSERRQVLEKAEWETLRGRLEEFLQEPVARFERTRRVFEERGRSVEGLGKMLRVSVRFFPNGLGSTAGKGRSFLKGLSGKTLFLLQEDPDD
jgi:hypothetical protein